MLQATLSDRLFLDLFPFSENGFIAAKVDLGGCDVVQALVVSLVVVVFDEVLSQSFRGWLGWLARGMQGFLVLKVSA